MHIEVDGRTLVDMYHIKESGTWTGWVKLEGERINVDGYHGGRDRTFGVRVADELDFWLWLDIGFEDRSLQAWAIESHDGSVQYVDGGITYVDGTVSDRFIRIDHEIRFDADHKRPVGANLVFTTEDGTKYQGTGESAHQEVGVYYGLPLPKLNFEDHDDGEYFFHFAWNSSSSNELLSMEKGAMSIDQLMRFDLDGMPGHGIFEILAGGRGPARYPNWPPMDMTPFRQQAKGPNQS